MASMLTENVAIALGVARIDAWLRKRVESVLPGIGFTDFVILNELASVVGGRLRPVDLANRLQMTASGVTRAILPLREDWPGRTRLSRTRCPRQLRGHHASRPRPFRRSPRRRRSRRRRNTRL